MTLDDYVDAIGLPSGGAVRASLGLASNLADIERFAAFAHEFVDLADVPDDLPVTRRLLTANPPRERRCFNRIVIGGRVSSRTHSDRGRR